MPGFSQEHLFVFFNVGSVGIFAAVIRGLHVGIGLAGIGCTVLTVFIAFIFCTAFTVAAVFTVFVIITILIVPFLGAVIVVIIFKAVIASGSKGKYGQT